MYKFNCARWSRYRATDGTNVTERFSAGLSLESSFILFSAAGLLQTVLLVVEWPLLF